MATGGASTARDNPVILNEGAMAGAEAAGTSETFIAGTGGSGGAETGKGAALNTGAGGGGVSEAGVPPGSSP